MRHVDQTCGLKTLLKIYKTPSVSFLHTSTIQATSCNVIIQSDMQAGRLQYWSRIRMVRPNYTCAMKRFKMSIKNKIAEQVERHFKFTLIKTSGLKCY